MGAYAFYTKNAHYCYEVELLEEFPEHDEEQDELTGWYYDELLECLNDTIEEEFKNSKYDNYAPSEVWDNERYYQGRYIREIRHEIKGSYLMIKPLVRNGYYDNVSLDYNIEVQIEGEYYPLDSIDEAVDCLKENGESWKLAKKSMERHESIITKKIEKIFDSFKTCYAPRNAWA